MSYILNKWKEYERVLFHRPCLALAKLLAMGATLCHCKKDASVAYTRHVFEDTSKMRDWRNEVLKHPDILGTYIPSAGQAYQQDVVVQQGLFQQSLATAALPVGVHR